MGRLSVYPRVPCHFTVSNGAVGNIYVSTHAWKRFCERHTGGLSSNKPLVSPEDFFTEQFRLSFARSREIVNVKRSALRMTRDGFRCARYFFDRRTYLCFVLQEGANSPNEWFIITVNKTKLK